MYTSKLQELVKQYSTIYRSIKTKPDDVNLKTYNDFLVNDFFLLI